MSKVEAHPEDWPGAARQFWEAARSLPGAPPSLTVQCTDTDDVLRFGDADAGAYEIHGPADGLCAVFSGELLLIDAAYLGRVSVLGTLPELSVLSGAGMDIHAGMAR